MPFVSDYYSARVDLAPLSAGDSDILEDIDFGDYANDSAFTTAHGGDGWVVNGTVEWTGTGVKVNSANSSLSNTTNSWQTDIINAGEGSIYFEVERSGLTVDEGDISGEFLQSSGRVGNATVAYLFGLSKTASPFDEVLFLYRHTSANSGPCILGVQDPTGGAQTAQAYINSTRLSNISDDQYNYARVIFTWKGKTVQLIIDGLPVATLTLTDAYTADLFDRFTVGNNAPTAGNIFGDYTIRRMQITKKQSLLVANPMKICFAGDSFMSQFCDGNNYTLLSDIQQLYDGSGRAGRHNGLAEFIRLFAVNHNFVLTNVVGFTQGTAGNQNGSTVGGGGFTSNATYTFSADWTNYIINQNPEVLITCCSVNDLNTGTPASDPAGDIQGYFDTIIAGCRSLREIHLFEGFFYWKGVTARNNQDNVDEFVRFNDLAKSLDGYTATNAAGETTTVFWHDTVESWQGNYGSPLTLDYDPDFTIGSATGNTVSANNELHPSPKGFLKIGEIFYNALKDNLSIMPILK